MGDDDGVVALECHSAHYDLLPPSATWFDAALLELLDFEPCASSKQQIYEQRTAPTVNIRINDKVILCVPSTAIRRRRRGGLTIDKLSPGLQVEVSMPLDGIGGTVITAGNNIGITADGTGSSPSGTVNPTNAKGNNNNNIPSTSIVSSTPVYWQKATVCAIKDNLITLQLTNDQIINVPITHLRELTSDKEEEPLIQATVNVRNLVTMDERTITAVLRNTAQHLNELAEKTDLLSITIGSTTNVTLLGTATRIAQVVSKDLPQLLQANKQLTSSHDRRERRLRVLAERTVPNASGDDRQEVLVDDGLWSLLVGRQGERLSRVARMHKVELRVLPDDKGTRRVRIYGTNGADAVRARVELEAFHQIIKFDPPDALESIQAQVLSDMARRCGIYAVWQNDTEKCLILWGNRHGIDTFCKSLERHLENSPAILPAGAGGDYTPPANSGSHHQNRSVYSPRRRNHPRPFQQNGNNRFKMAPRLKQGTAW